MFSDSLKITLEHEGYYANNSSDKGGETYRGIARNYHPNWTGWKYIDAEKAKKGGSLPTNYKINNIVLDELIEQFYKVKFWDRIYLDKILDSNLQTIIFDAYVNSGGNGIKLMQRTLNNKFNKNLKVDGAQGMNTVNAINSVNAALLFDAYKTARANYYRSIATGSNAIFLSNWLSRLYSFNYVNVGIGLAGIAVITVGGFFL